jgi:hypothetical protein
MSEITLKINLPEHLETLLKTILNGHQVTQQPCASNEEEIWNVDDVCAAFKIPKTKLYSLTMRSGEGAIPRFKIGRDLRFKKSETIEWFNDQRDGLSEGR